MKDELAVQEIMLNHLNAPDDKILAQQVAELRLESKKNEEIFQEILFIWDTAPLTRRLDGFDPEASVRKFHDQVVPKRARFGWLRIAVAAAVVLTVFLVYPRKREPVFIVKETRQRMDSVTLSDGTSIVLAAHTTIKFAKEFDDQSRQLVLMKGQAFFKVHRDVKRPFTVVMGKAELTVLGTSFNINYTDKFVRLAVVTGKVRFVPNPISNPSILTAGQALDYNIAQNTIVMENGANANSWITKKLEFIDMPLDEVCKQLSIYYNVNIVFQDRRHSQKKFNANFKDSSLQEVMAVLKQTYKVQIDSVQGAITIKIL